LACNQPNLESLNQENKISSDNSVLYSPGILDATGTLEPKLCPVHGTLMEIIPTPETVKMNLKKIHNFIDFQSFS